MHQCPSRAGQAWGPGFAMAQRGEAEGLAVCSTMSFSCLVSSEGSARPRGWSPVPQAPSLLPWSPQIEFSRGTSGGALLLPPMPGTQLVSRCSSRSGARQGRCSCSRQAGCCPAVDSACAASSAWGSACCARGMRPALISGLVGLIPARGVGPEGSRMPRGPTAAGLMGGAARGRGIPELPSQEGS